MCRWRMIIPARRRSWIAMWCSGACARCWKTRAGQGRARTSSTTCNVLANHGITLGRHPSRHHAGVLRAGQHRHPSRHGLVALKYLVTPTIHYEDVAGKGAKQLQLQPGPAGDRPALCRRGCGRHPAPAPDHVADTRGVAGLAANLSTRSRCRWCRCCRAWSEPAWLSTPPCWPSKAGNWRGALPPLEQEAHQPWPGSRSIWVRPSRFRKSCSTSCICRCCQNPERRSPPRRRRCWRNWRSIIPLPRLILEHRGLSKLKSTYTDRLPEQIDPAHRTRPHLLPSGGGHHRPVVLVRSQPAEHPGPHRGGAAHPSGLHRPAGLCRCSRPITRRSNCASWPTCPGTTGLLRAFAAGEDIHRATAAEVFGVAAGAGDLRAATLRQGHQLRSDLRHVGLRSGAAAGYRRGVRPRNTSTCYFARYPGVVAFMDDTRRQAREQGYVETVFGRRLYLPDIKSRNEQRRSGGGAHRHQCTHAGNGGGHHQARHDAGWTRWIKSQHDVDVTHDHAGARRTGLRGRRRSRGHSAGTNPQPMTAAAELRVPLVVDVGVGNNWDEAH